MGSFSAIETGACALTTGAASNSNQYGRLSVTATGCAVASGIVEEGLSFGVGRAVARKAASAAAGIVPFAGAGIKAGYAAIKINKALDDGNECLAVTEGIAGGVDTAGSFIPIPLAGAGLREASRGLMWFFVPEDCMPSHSMEGQLVIDVAGVVGTKIGNTVHPSAQAADTQGRLPPSARTDLAPAISSEGASSQTQGIQRPSLWQRTLEAMPPLI